MARAPLVLAGDVDVDNADAQLVGLLQQAARYGEDLPPEIEIDCSRVTFVGSAGLAMLVKLRARLERRITLVEVPASVRRPFELTGLDRIFELRDRTVPGR